MSSRWRRWRRRSRESVAAIRSGWKAWRRVRRQSRAIRSTGRPVVWWLLTPAARMRNLGDQAQAVAVAAWLREPVGVGAIELDKDEVRWLAPVLSRLIRPGELILLQSGGNMGERGRLTEQLRRRIVDDFPANPILSLPQTISFSDSEDGRREADRSAASYRAHAELEIVARDTVSLQRGQALFGQRVVHRLAPDPVLLMASQRAAGGRRGTLLVLRDDAERALSADDHAALAAAVTTAMGDRGITRFDTKIGTPVRRGQRGAIVGAALDRFAAHEVVVTDRFHGMVFAFITDTPCVVLENVDHKISSGIAWLEGCEAVRLVDDVAEVEAAIAAVRSAPPPSSSTAVARRVDDAWAELAASVRGRALGSGAAARPDTTA